MIQQTGIRKRFYDQFKANAVKVATGNANNGFCSAHNKSVPQK